MSDTQRFPGALKAALRTATLVAVLGLSATAATPALAAPVSTPAAVQPAQSAPTRAIPQYWYAGCEVTPLTPRFAYYGYYHRRVIDYPVRVSCQPYRTIWVDQEFWQLNRNRGWYLGHQTHQYRFGRYGGTVEIHSYRYLENTHSRYEAVYQRARYQVEYNHHWSYWSRWEWSRTAYIRF